MSIGYKIKKIREIKGYTQEFMADKLGMSPQGYGKLERDEADVPFTRLEQIAKVFDLKLNDIADFDEKMVFNNYGSAINYAANATISNLSDNEKKLYEDKVRLLEEQIVFLKETILELKNRK